MKASELRIGNSIMQDDDFVFVTGWRLEFIGKNKLEYKPIPLTKEWLFKFGFEMINKSYFELKVGGIIFEYTKDLNHNWYILINEDIRVYLDYVHQFQNLYFSLINKELEIKDDYYR